VSTARATRSTLAELGALPALLYAVHRMLQRLSDGRSALVCYGLYAQPVGAGRYASVRDHPATVIARADPASPLTASFPRPAAVIESRFRHGAQCYAGTVKGRFAGFIWLAHGGHDEDEVRCRYALPDAPGAVWDFDVYVEPSLRMGRTLARLWKAVDAQLVQEGVRWSFSRISLFNPPSITTHERLGAQRVGWAVFLCIGPAQLAVFGMAPYLHFSIGGRPPTLRLRPPTAPQKQNQ
jgi:hypothetical protein